MSNTQDFDPSIEATKAKFGSAFSKKNAFAAFVLIMIIFGIFSGISFFAKTNGKTVDDKLTTLKELRDDKKSREDIIEEQKKAIYTLDQKIIPLKCEIYSEVGAKDTWESECRDSFEEQQNKITNQVSSQLEEAVVPDYQ